MIFDLNLGLGSVLVPMLLILLFASLRILREYERGVVFQLGRFWKVKGPGLVIVIPGIQQMVRVDLRVVTMDVEPQDVISRDNVSVKVNAVVFFRVVDPQKAIIQVEQFLMATSQLAQTTLRVVLGKHELDEMLAERERLNIDVQKILDAQTDAWGVKVTNVEIKHIDLNESMIRAIARQAEAERERRAKVIHAEGEKQAAAALLEAATTLAQRPEAMQLRYLQTMTQVAGDRATTVVLPLPLDLINALTAKTGPAAGGAAQAAREGPDLALQSLTMLWASSKPRAAIVGLQVVCSELRASRQRS
jgi:regulator of protease activity HflC (stomatin/prohibitin superfamily)